jgi:polyferredoxin
LGSLQAVLGDYKYSFSFYVTGLMLGFGLVFGRFICGFLCPFGLIQELLHKIPFWRVKRVLRGFLYIKYVLLAVFVVAMPLLMRNFTGLGSPAFCKYICPAGTITAGLPLLTVNPSMRKALGWLFVMKSAIAVLTVVGCIPIYRFFCKIVCPLGAFYGLFNKIALCRIHLEKSKCVHCKACAKACKMAVDPCRESNSAECIRCGDCVNACRFSALSFGFNKEIRRTLTCTGEAIQNLFERRSD